MNVWKKLLILLFDNDSTCYAIAADLAAFVIEIMSCLLIIKLPGMHDSSAGLPNPQIISVLKSYKVTGRIQEHLTERIQSNIYLGSIYYMHLNWMVIQLPMA